MSRTSGNDYGQYRFSMTPSHPSLSSIASTMSEIESEKSAPYGAVFQSYSDLADPHRKVSSGQVRPISTFSSISSFRSSEYELEEAELPQTKHRGRPKKSLWVIGCAVAISFGIIMGLIVYLAIMPAVIRSRFASSQSYLYPDNVTGTILSNNSVDFTFRGEIFIRGFPVNARFSPGFLQVATKDGTIIVDEIPYPAIDMFSSKRSNLDYSGTLKFGDINRMQQLLKAISEEGPSGDLGELLVTTGLGITFLGINFYPNLRVSRILDAVISGNRLPGNLGLVREPDPTLVDNPRRPPFTSFQFPILSMDRISFVDPGITVDTQLTFRNPLPLSAKAPSVSMQLNLFDTPIVRGRVRNFVLPPQDQEVTIRPSFDLIFVSDVFEIRQRIQAAVNQFINSGFFPISISGPIEWNGPVAFERGREVAMQPTPDATPAPWLSQMTRNFKIDIPVLQLLTIAISRLQNSGNLGGVDFQQILRQISLNVNLTNLNGTTVIPVSLSLPGMRVLPSLKMDYFFGFSLGLLGAQLINAGISDISIQPSPLSADTKVLSWNISVNMPTDIASLTPVFGALMPEFLSGSRTPFVSIRNLTVTATTINVDHCSWCERALSGFALDIPLSLAAFQDTARRILPGNLLPAEFSGNFPG
ncbi:hypothetical protein BKA69DRAFT_1125755 [Paraphysoderma sedebokerense]|nr:hypothetical protein BKA69DRAFT_1125755 [Paraphysoderma sedebokerense]